MTDPREDPQNAPDPEAADHSLPTRREIPVDGPDGSHTPAGEVGEPPVSDPATTGGADADTVLEPSPEEALLAEATRWKDLAHRAAADLDNFRKRAAKERSDAIRYANASLLEELLPVIDNFEWGLQAASDDQGSPIYQGMAMVGKQLVDFLGSQGVETIDALGKEFDPNIHDAVAQEPNDDVPENFVINQTRKGYRLHGRLIRPATVTVSRGSAEQTADA